MKRSLLATGLVALALPASTGAHVTVHPNAIPEGSYPVVNIRVPNETDDADTTKVEVQLPDGFSFAAAEPPPGWKVAMKKTKLATPIKTDDGEITEQVKDITFSGGSIPPGEFRQFPLQVGIPGKAGDTLTFKALQTYDNGDVVRWIGAPDADQPAPTVAITAKGGLVEDTTAEGGAPPQPKAQAAPAATTRVVERKAGNGLSVVALIVGALGLAAGGYAISARRKP